MSKHKRTNKISLPHGVIAPDNGKTLSVEISLTAAELDLIRNTLMKRHKIVFDRLLSLKREYNRVKTQVEDNILLSVLKRMGRIKYEKRYPLKAFDTEWKEIIYCLEHSRSKSKATQNLIEFLSKCLFTD